MQERPAGESPHLASAIHQRAPLTPGVSTERVVKRHGASRGIHTGNGGRGSVREVVAESWLHFLEIDFLFQRSAGLHEQIAVDRGQSEQTRAGVEREAVASIGSQLSTDVGRGLEQLNGVTLDGQSCRCR